MTPTNHSFNALQELVGACLVACLATFCTSCDSGSRETAPTGEPPVQADVPPPAATEHVEQGPVGNLPDHPGVQWLTAVAHDDDERGGWATGSFDAKRNRIIVHTRDLEAFAVDTSLLPVKWEKLVILRIDGRNSELVRRDQSRFHFVRDPRRGWQVHE